MNEPIDYSKFLYVFFGNKMVVNGERLELQTVLKQPKITFDRIRKANKDKYHTIVIVDPDAVGNFCIHYCIYNIPEDRVNYGKVFYDYHPPTPPAGTGPHRYFTILYEQDGKIEEDLGVGVNRKFSKYLDFLKLLKVKMTTKAAKYFISEYENKN